MQSCTKLNMDISAWDSNKVECSSAYFAVPMNGGGGPIGVFKHTDAGAFPQPELINHHKMSVLDMGFSPFDPLLMCSGGDDSTVNVWKLPEVGQGDSVIGGIKDLQPIATYAMGRKVGIVNFHPTASNLVVSASIDKCVKIFDIEKGADVLKTKVRARPLWFSLPDDAPSATVPASCCLSFTHDSLSRAPTTSRA